MTFDQLVTLARACGSTMRRDDVHKLVDGVLALARTVEATSIGPLPVVTCTPSLKRAIGVADVDAQGRMSRRYLTPLGARAYAVLLLKSADTAETP